MCVLGERGWDRVHYGNPDTSNVINRRRQYLVAVTVVAVAVAVAEAIAEKVV